MGGVSGFCSTWKSWSGIMWWDWGRIGSPSSFQSLISHSSSVDSL